MNERSRFWLAATGVLAAALALGVAVVAARACRRRRRRAEGRCCRTRSTATPGSSAYARRLPPTRDAGALEDPARRRGHGVDVQRRRPRARDPGALRAAVTLNGKSFPATETVKVARGERALLRLVGAGSASHPMHLHGTDFTVVAKDGHPLAAPFRADVIQVGSGEWSRSPDPGEGRPCTRWRTARRWTAWT